MKKYKLLEHIIVQAKKIGAILIIPFIWAAMLVISQSFGVHIHREIIACSCVVAIILRYALYNNVKNEFLIEHQGEIIYYVKHLLVTILSQLSWTGVFLYFSSIYRENEWVYLSFSILVLVMTFVMTGTWIQHFLYATFERWYNFWKMVNITIASCAIAILAAQDKVNKEFFVVGLLGFYFWLTSEQSVKYFQYRYYLDSKDKDILVKIPIGDDTQIEWAYWYSAGLFSSISFSIVMSMSAQIRRLPILHDYMQSNNFWISEITIGFIIISLSLFLTVLILLYVNSKKRPHIPVISRFIGNQQQIVLNHIDKSSQATDSLQNASTVIEVEEEVEIETKRQAIKIFTLKFERDEIGTLHHLAKIHRILFENIYNDAGEVRTSDMSKGGFTFTKIPFLKDSLSYIDSLLHSTFDEIITKYVAMNEAHPFIDGNGRAMRLWLNHMLQHAIEQVVDWSQIEKEDYLLAMSRSPIKDIELKHYLSRSLTDQVDDFEIFCRGLDASWYYEGYYNYNSRDLIENLDADEKQ